MTIIPLTGGVNPFPALREARPAARASSRCSPTATSPPAGSRSTCAATRARMAPGPAALAAGRAPPAAPGLDPRTSAGGRGVGHRHHLPPAGRRARRRARTRERATAMTQACADVLGAAIAEHTQRLAHAAAGLPRRPRPGPPRGRATRREGARDEDRPGLPLLVGRARRGAVPRARPRRALHPRGATTSRCSPPPTTTPPLPDYVTSAGRPVPVRYNGSVARVTFGPGDHGPGAAAGSRPGASTCCTCTSRSTRRRRCWRCGPRPSRWSRPSTPRMLRSRALHAAHPLLRPVAGEDPRRGSPSPRTPAHRAAPPRGRRRSSSPTVSTSTTFAARPPLRPEWAGTAAGTDAGVPRPGRRAAQGSARWLLGGAARGARRPPRHPAARRRAAVTPPTC